MRASMAGLALASVFAADPAAAVPVVTIEHRGADLVSTDPDLVGGEWERRPGFEFRFTIDGRRFPGPLLGATFGWLVSERCDNFDVIWQPLRPGGPFGGTFCLDEGEPWPPAWLTEFESTFPLAGVAGGSWSFALDESGALTSA